MKCCRFAISPSPSMAGVPNEIILHIEAWDKKVLDYSRYSIQFIKSNMLMRLSYDFKPTKFKYYKYNKAVILLCGSRRKYFDGQVF